MTIAQRLLSTTLTPPLRRASFAARTLVSSIVSVALFALVTLSAKEASAYETTSYLFFYNNTPSTVTFTNAWFSGSNNQWVPCGAGGDVVTNGNQIYQIFPQVYPPGNTNPLAPLGPSPPFVADTAAGGPGSWSVAPGTATCFEAATATPLFGTGGTIEYTWSNTTTNTSNPTTTSYEGQIVWSDPWTAAHGDISQTSYPTCAHQIQACPGGTFAGCPGNWGYAEDVFSIGEPVLATTQPGMDHCVAIDGVAATGSDIFTYELDQWPPTHTGDEDMSGYPGDSIVIYGTNFDTTGLTQVFFNSSPSPSVICATSTQCTAVVPTTIPIPNATSQVTIDVLGDTTSVGTFTFLPLGPECVYSTAETATDSFLVQCTPDSLGDPIWIFKLNDSGVWEFAYNYVGSSDQYFLSSVPGGTTDTFVGCFSINGGFPNPGSSSTSTLPGCDSPKTITMPVKRVPR